MPRQPRRFGRRAACDTLEAWPGARRRTIRLQVAGAFHTNMMKPADQALADALAGITMRNAAHPGLVQRRCQAAHRPW